MDKEQAFILWFDQLGIEDVPLVGGKNASLGEMYRHLAPKSVRIPPMVLPLQHMRIATFWKQPELPKRSKTFSPIWIHRICITCRNGHGCSGKVRAHCLRSIGHQNNRGRSDRIWLAGEAAHTTPQASALSMNVGIREAVDLVNRLGSTSTDAKRQKTLEQHKRNYRDEWQCLLDLDHHISAANKAARWLLSHRSSFVSNTPAHPEIQIAIGIDFDSDSIFANLSGIGIIPAFRILKYFVLIRIFA